MLLVTVSLNSRIQCRMKATSYRLFQAREIVEKILFIIIYC